jgi:predicted aspartyl protease
MRPLFVCLSRFVLLLVSFLSVRAFGVGCPVAAPVPTSDAQTAFLHADYDKAAALYQQQLTQHPNDPQLSAALVRVLLRQEKVAEAADVVKKAVAAQPKSAVLLTAQAEVLYRQGTPWLAADATQSAIAIDPCYPRVHLMLATLYRLNSLYGSEKTELQNAHALDPSDPDIQGAWLDTLPLKERITEVEAYLASPTGDDADEVKRTKRYLDFLKKRIAEPRKPCRLASDATSTQIPFALLMYDATHIRAFGLEVKVNDHKQRLEIDTGASGLLIGRAGAEKAGLKPFETTEVGGIGSHGEKNGYVAYADSIQIGSLVFHDCEVRVLDSKNVLDSDGLIGMDVFSNFLVALDYPMQKLELGPLPPRPSDSGPQMPTLQTDQGADEDASEVGGDTAANAGSKTAPAPPARKGPQDRYVAPEMKTYSRIYRVGHQLLIPTSLNLNPNRKLFILDTGAWSTTISPEAAREFTKLHSDNDLEVRGISGKVEKVYTADNVTFYFANIKQPAKEVVSFDTSNISKGTGLEVSGFIGAATLAQLTMHIDYRDGLVKFDYDPNHYQRLLPH